MGFFNMNSKSFRFMTKVGDFILLSLLWILFSLPVVTCGAATAALYYAVHKVIHDLGSGTVKEFWKGFRSNFGQATIIWLVVLILAGILGGDLILIYRNTGSVSSTPFLAFAVFDLIAVVWTLYFFPYIARFEAKTGTILKNSFILLTMNIGPSVFLLADFAAAVILAVSCYDIILVPLFLPALYMLCANLILERVFAKYMSSEAVSENEEAA